MKFWEKLNGDCGTMDDDGYVPDSIETTKAKYDNFVAAHPIIEPVNEIVEYEDIDTEKRMKLRRVS